MPPLCSYLGPDGHFDLGRGHSGLLLSMPGLGLAGLPWRGRRDGHLVWEALPDRWLSGRRTYRAETDPRRGWLPATMKLTETSQASSDSDAERPATRNWVTRPTAAVAWSREKSPDSKPARDRRASPKARQGDQGPRGEEGIGERGPCLYVPSHIHGSL